MAGDQVLIAVAPNGAGKSKHDHAGLPLSLAELTETAMRCLAVGAAMMHFHVRDGCGRHTLDHRIYRPVLKELESAVGTRMLLQVSSESAGRYRPCEQIEEMKRLAPHCLSCGLREIIEEQVDYAEGHTFFTALRRAGVLVQYILYSPADVKWYETLCDAGVIPGDSHLLLFVLGKHMHTGEVHLDLLPYLAELKRESPWMSCGFGQLEHSVVAQTVKLGGHVRVGFENNHHLPDGSPAPDNGALVKLAADLARSAGRGVGDKLFAESLHWRVIKR